MFVYKCATLNWLIVRIPETFDAVTWGCWLRCRWQQRAKTHDSPGQGRRDLAFSQKNTIARLRSLLWRRSRGLICTTGRSGAHFCVPRVSDTRDAPCGHFSRLATLHCGASHHLQYFVLFSLRSSGYQWGCTEKCIFMDKEVREISRFFVAPPCEFAPAVWAARNHTPTHKYTQLSTVAAVSSQCWWNMSKILNKASRMRGRPTLYTELFHSLRWGRIKEIRKLCYYLNIMTTLTMMRDVILSGFFCMTLQHLKRWSWFSQILGRFL